MGSQSHSNPPYEEGLRFSRQGKHAQAIGCFEQALAAEPSSPRVLFALGNTARALDMVEPAQMFFRQVLALEPGRVEALVNLANLLTANGQPQAAKTLLTPALARNPSATELWLTLGSALREMEDFVGAETHYREALNLAPTSAAALSNLGDLLAMRGENEAALAYYDRALRHAPDSAQARFNRAILHLLRGDLKQGWRDYAARVKIPGKTPICDHRLPVWSGGPLKNKRLLVTAEQGVGDELMFASLIPELARRAAADGGSVILECDPRLVPLFARSFSGVTAHAFERQKRDGVVHAHFGWLKSVGGANLSIELGSLPRYLHKSIDGVGGAHAYLDADDVEVLDWTRSLSQSGTAPFVGICWRSGKMTNGRAQQFAPLTAWADFLRDLPATPVCVQYDATPEEIEELASLSGRTIVVPGGIDQKQELDRACALLSALDAVVSAPTAVSWLAAASGVPTYKIQAAAGWTSFGRDVEPFAPSCIPIVSDTPGDWSACFTKAKAALSSRL